MTPEEKTEYVQEATGWSLDPYELKVRDWAVDQQVMEMGGCGKIGRILDIQGHLCLVKYHRTKALWVHTNILLHYTEMKK